MSLKMYLIFFSLHQQPLDAQDVQKGYSRIDICVNCSYKYFKGITYFPSNMNSYFPYLESQ